ncbi:sodium/hydrogen exchanger 9B2 isoform X3 [Bemisia tabaci]|uniref:sodium/hydrogen exchanger 9B2 isoform X3 n=1 Tax=Bemisia tabaci TaxID=7038 RepID=UPI003B2833F0
MMDALEATYARKGLAAQVDLKRKLMGLRYTSDFVKIEKYEHSSPRDREVIKTNKSKSVAQNVSSINASSLDNSESQRGCSAQPFGPKNHWYLTWVTNALCVVLLYLVLYFLLKNEMLPGGQLLSLLAVILCAYFVGQVVKLMHLPPLLGMLVTGIIFRNTGLFHADGVYREAVLVLRDVALTTILIKAGLGLDPKAMRKLSMVVLGLSFVPCLVEAAGVAIFAFVILGFPWVWGFSLGFVLSAVSPAVVVPTLLKLQNEGYGESKGIATMVIAASSLDDVVAISAFGLCLSLVLDEKDSNLVLKFIKGPAEAIGGLIIGTLWGILVGYLPHQKEQILTVRRAFLVGAGGLTAVLGAHHLGYPGAGPLVSITAAFVACICWKNQGYSVEYNPVETVFSGIWKILQPTLFGLTGAEIDFNQIHGATILEGIGVLAGGLLFRVVGCCLVLISTKLNFKEVVFVNIAWLPKATVQAALGSVLLDSVLAMESHSDQEVKFGRDCLTIAVLSILITAPIGAIGISILGPKCLSTEGAKGKTTKLEVKKPASKEDNIV